MGKGVRGIKIEDQIPNCDIYINKQLYNLEDLVRNKKVLDIGCGYGKNEKTVINAGGEWLGVEPFSESENIVKASAEDLPFEDNAYDVVIMDAVLEHIPNVHPAFAEVSRVLKPGGIFIGYVAFMECFHEISYSHLSHKALEHFSDINNMKLEKISGGRLFGIDYHLNVLFYPLPVKYITLIVPFIIRFIIRAKSKIGYLGLRIKRKLSHLEALTLSKDYYKVECLRQSVGFSYIIRKKN